MVFQENSLKLNPARAGGQKIKKKIFIKISSELMQISFTYLFSVVVEMWGKYGRWGGLNCRKEESPECLTTHKGASKRKPGLETADKK